MSYATPVRTVYQFLYGNLPPAGSPVSIDSSGGDAEDEFVQKAFEIGEWIPLGPVLLLDPAARGPVPKMTWHRKLIVPAEEMKRSEVPLAQEGAPAKPRLVDVVPPGTTVEDLLRRR